MWLFVVGVWFYILCSLWRAIGVVVPWILWRERERGYLLVVCLDVWLWWKYCRVVSCSRCRILCRAAHICWCSIPGILGLSWFWRVLFGPSPEGSFEIGEGRVYVYFWHLGVVVHYDVCRKVVVYLSVSHEAIRCVTEDALCLCPGGSLCLLG
jgi:hypothetical protein